MCISLIKAMTKSLNKHRFCKQMTTTWKHICAYFSNNYEYETNAFIVTEKCREAKNCTYEYKQRKQSAGGSFKLFSKCCYISSHNTPKLIQFFHENFTLFNTYVFNSRACLGWTVQRKPKIQLPKFKYQRLSSYSFILRIQ